MNKIADPFGLSPYRDEVSTDHQGTIANLRRDNLTLSRAVSNLERSVSQLNKRLFSVCKEKNNLKKDLAIIERKSINGYAEDKKLAVMYKRDYDAYKLLFQQKKAELTRANKKIVELKGVIDGLKTE